MGRKGWRMDHCCWRAQEERIRSCVEMKHKGPWYEKTVSNHKEVRFLRCTIVKVEETR